MFPTNSSQHPAASPTDGRSSNSSTFNSKELIILIWSYKNSDSSVFQQTYFLNQLDFQITQSDLSSSVNNVKKMAEIKTNSRRLSRTMPIYGTFAN